MTDVEMPDGTIIQDVPDGVTQTELLSRLGKLEGGMTREQTPSFQGMRAVPEPAVGIQPPANFAAGDLSSLLPENIGPKLDLANKLMRRGAGITQSTEEIATMLPPLAATIATLPMGGAGGAVAGGAERFLIPPLIKAVGRLAAKPGTLALGAARAGAGGAAGGALEAELTGQDPAELAKLRGKQQAIIDPLARLTLGLGKFLLRPAGNLAAEATRLLKFARKEGLQIDPGAATDKLVPKVVSTFAKGFLGSRPFATRQIRAIANHISADPTNASSFVNRAIAAVTPASIKSSATFTRPLTNIIQKATTVVGPKRAVIVDGDILASEIRSRRKALAGKFGEGVISRLENFAVYAKAHPEAPLFLAQDPIFSRQSLIVNAIVFPSIALDPTQASTVAFSLGTLLSSQIFNSRSVVSRWLTTGVPPTGMAALGVPSSFGIRSMVPRGAEKFQGMEPGEKSKRRQRVMGLQEEAARMRAR